MCTACTLQRIHNRSCSVLVFDKCATNRRLLLWLPHELGFCQHHIILLENWNCSTPVACQCNPLSKIPHEQRKNAWSTDALGWGWRKRTAMDTSILLGICYRIRDYSALLWNPYSILPLSDRAGCEPIWAIHQLWPKHILTRNVRSIHRWWILSPEKQRWASIWSSSL